MGPKHAHKAAAATQGRCCRSPDPMSTYIKYCSTGELVEGPGLQEQGLSFDTEILRPSIV
jgi:hypothetical protein